MRGLTRPLRIRLARNAADLGEWRQAYEQQARARQISLELLRRQVDNRFATLKVQSDTEARERELLYAGVPTNPVPEREVPRLHEFVNRFLDRHARADREKPSGIAGKETILRVHLVPLLGSRKLDRASRTRTSSG